MHFWDFTHDPENFYPVLWVKVHYNKFIFKCAQNTNSWIVCSKLHFVCAFVVCITYTHYQNPFIHFDYAHYFDRHQPDIRISINMHTMRFCIGISAMRGSSYGNSIRNLMMCFYGYAFIGCVYFISKPTSCQLSLVYAYVLCLGQLYASLLCVGNHLRIFGMRISF